MRMEINIKTVWLSLLIMTMMCTNALAACRKEAEIPSSIPDGQLQDNNDNTVTDTETGLMWKKCVEGFRGNDCSVGYAFSYKWQEALALSDQAGDAGYSDWRLPSTAELLSLIEHRCYSPAINSLRFPNTISLDYWSGSLYAAGQSDVWYVNFAYGYSYHRSFKDNKLLVRLVRLGELTN